MSENKKLFSIIGVVITIIMFLFLYQLEINLSQPEQKLEEIQSPKEIWEIVDKQEELLIEERFIGERNYLNSIVIHMNTIMERVTNVDYPIYTTSIVIGLKEMDTQKIIKEDTITNFLLTKVENNQYSLNDQYKFEFPMQKESKGKNYSIYLKYQINLEEKEIFSPIYSAEDKIENGVLYINSIREEGDILVEYQYNRMDKIIVVMIVLLLVGIILLTTLHFTYKNLHKMPIEKLFLIIVPILCLLFMIFMPEKWGTDETIHFYRCYDLTQGKIVYSLTEDNRVLTQLPAEIKEIENKKIGETKEEVNILNDAVYSPIQFIPEIVGMKIGLLFTKNATHLFYIARISNMICCIALLYLAIKIIPVGKKVLFLLALIPSTIESISIISQDGITIAISFLFIAYILKIIYDNNNQMRKKDYCIIPLLAIILSQCKIVYFPIILLILCIPKERFKSNKKKWLWILLTLFITFIASITWMDVASKYMIAFNGGISEINKQILLQHPIRIFQMMLHTAAVNFPTYFREAFGGGLGWFHIIELNVIPFILFMTTLITATGEEKQKGKFNIAQKIIMIIIILAIIGLILLSEFLTWTSLR